MNTPLTIQQIEFLKNLLTEKTQAPNNFTAELYQTFKAEIITILQKLFQKTEVKKIFSNSFYEDNITLITKTRNGISHRTRTNNLKICMEPYKTLNSQNNLEKEELKVSCSLTSGNTTKLQ